MLLWGGKLVWDAKDSQAEATSTASGQASPLPLSPPGKRHATGDDPASPTRRLSSELAAAGGSGKPNSPHNPVRYHSSGSTGSGKEQASQQNPRSNQRALINLGTLLGGLQNLSAVQLHYVQTVMEPMLVPLLLEVVNSMPDKLGGFLLQWLVAHLQVPRSISNPMLSWLKTPPPDWTVLAPKPQTCDKEQQTDHEAAPEATPERCPENGWLAPSVDLPRPSSAPDRPNAEPDRPAPDRHTTPKLSGVSSQSSRPSSRGDDEQEECDDEEARDAFDDSRISLDVSQPLVVETASGGMSNSILKRRKSNAESSRSSRGSIIADTATCDKMHRRVSIRKTPTNLPDVLDAVGAGRSDEKDDAPAENEPYPTMKGVSMPMEPTSSGGSSSAPMSARGSASTGRRVSMAVGAIDGAKDRDGPGGAQRNSSLSRKGSVAGAKRARAISIVEPAPEVPHLGMVEMIKSNSLFEQLDEDEVHLLARCAQVKSFDPDEEVIGYGEKVGELHMIWSGEGRVCVPKQVGVLKKGDSFGEHALSKRHLSSTTTVSAHTGDQRLVTIAVTYQDLARLGIARKLRRAWNQTSKTQRRVQRTGTAPKPNKPKRQSQSNREDSKKTAKSQEDRKLIGASIRANTHLMEWLQLSDKQVDTMINLMKLEVVESGQEVTRKGDKGDTFYIVMDGMLEVVTEQRQTDTFHTYTFRAGDSFGELALLYNTPRKATVRAVRPSNLWVLTRAQFCMVMKLKSDARVREYEQLINSVSLLSERLTREEKEMLADTLEEVFFVRDEEVVRQGQEGDNFFMILEGECEVKINDHHQGTLTRGCYFGERALLSREPRAATVMVKSDTATLLTLDGASFELLLSHSLEDHVHSKPKQPQADGGEDMESAGSYHVLKHRSSIDLIRQMVQKQVVNCQRKEVPRENLEFIGVLGHGSFASVTLQKDVETGKLYALKAISKGYIKKEKLNQMVLNEKRTMMMLDSDFTIRLHCTYNCPQFLYFLLEPCFGGELFEVFSHNEEFFGSENHAKFWTICCAIGLEHLHQRRIIYRDLKLENVLLHENGYALLTDLGLAKVVIGKTYTVCGTADYFAPETLKRVGHNRAVDWWALGVMLFVMLTGRSPFDAEDVMQIYKNIVKGFKKETFPSDMTADQVEVIKGMCRKKPEERIPMSANGMKDLESQSFFVLAPKIPWDLVRNRTWTAPFTPPPIDMNEIANAVNPADVPYFNSENESDQSWDEDF